MDFKQFSKPFPAERVEWRAGSTNTDKTKAMALAYIDSRAVMERLDEVVGPENWQDNYEKGPDGGVLCAISIKVYEEWITKKDGAENSDFEPVKGGLSDAFKRAAVKWGIGRYLYDVPAQWVACEVFGKTVKLKEKPILPKWALPGNEPKPTEKTTPGAAQYNTTPTGEQKQAEPANKQRKPGDDIYISADVLQPIIEQYNLPASRLVNAFKYSALPSDPTSEQVTTWMAAYRAAKDAGKTVPEAAKIANETIA